MNNAHILALAITILMIMCCSILIVAAIRAEGDRIISALKGRGAARRIDAREPGRLTIDRE